VAKRVMQFQLSTDSHEAWKQAVTFVVNNTEKTSPEILRKAGIAYCMAGRKVTPHAKKTAKREIEQFIRGKRGESSLYRAKVLTQHKQPKWVMYAVKGGIQNARRHPVAQVPNKGAAKGSWNGIMRKIGGRVDTLGIRQTERLGNARFLSRYSLMLVNRLSYLFKIAKNVTTVARMNAARQMILSTEATMERTARAF
jgi:hypothetical protein